MSQFGTKGDILYRKVAKQFLQQSGTKVAIQVGFDGTYIFAVKGDFVTEILDSSNVPAHFRNYDGGEEYVWYEDNVLYIPIGIS